MTDISRLANGLADYTEALSRHGTQVADVYHEVERAWLTLSEIYEGSAAEDFANHWGLTQQMFRRYMEEVANLQRFLRDKVEQVQALDAAGLG